MRISDWSSDVCSSDLRYLRFQRFGLEHLEPALGRRTLSRRRRQRAPAPGGPVRLGVHRHHLVAARCGEQRGDGEVGGAGEDDSHGRGDWGLGIGDSGKAEARKSARGATRLYRIPNPEFLIPVLLQLQILLQRPRSEEHTSELQSLMRISYAVFCLKKKNQTSPKYHIN